MSTLLTTAIPLVPSTPAGPATVRSTTTRAARAGAVTLFGLAIAVGTAVLTATPASAHDRLLGSVPAAGSTVRAPDRVRLTLSEDVVPVGSRIVVAGSSGPVTGRLTASGADLSQTFRDELAAGKYTVTWRAVSSDGHPISGRFGFTVRGSSGESSPGEPPTTSTPAPSGTASAGADGPASAAGAGPVTAPSTPGEDAGSGVRTVAVAGLAVGGLATAAGVVALARRRPGSR